MVVLGGGAVSDERGTTWTTCTAGLSRPACWPLGGLMFLMSKVPLYFIDGTLIQCESAL